MAELYQLRATLQSLGSVWNSVLSAAGCFEHIKYTRGIKKLVKINYSIIRILLLNNFAPLNVHSRSYGFNELCEFAGVPQMMNPLHSLWKRKQLWSTELCMDLNDV